MLFVVIRMQILFDLSKDFGESTWLLRMYKSQYQAWRSASEGSLGNCGEDQTLGLTRPVDRGSPGHQTVDLRGYTGVDTLASADGT